MNEPTESLLGAHLFRALLFSGFLAPPLSVVLLMLYRRRVVRAMRSRSKSDGAYSPELVTHAKAASRSAADPEAIRLEFQTRSPVLEGEAALLRNDALRRPLMIAALSGAAGIAGALVISLGYLLVGSFEVNPLSLLMLSIIVAWPVVLVFNLVAASSPKTLLRSIGAYTAVVVVVAAATRVAASELATLWLIQNALPTVFFLIALNRPIRAVGPTVLAFLMVVAVGMEYVLAILSEPGVQLSTVSRIAALGGLGPNATIVSVTLIGLTTFGVAGWFVSRSLGFLYSRKRLSDQLVTLDAMWLLFFVWGAIVIAARDVRWLPVSLVAFFVVKAVDIVGRRVLLSQRNQPTLTRPPRLLLLRVFSRSSRYEKLFVDLEKHWRYIGTVVLITGPDLATTIVEPHDFLDFVSGRLRRRFIATAEALERRLSELDERPDPDGRFRINDLFCYEDRWQKVVRRLANEVDTIVMDLRGFTGVEAGCVFEIKMIVNAVPLDRVVTLVDQITNESAVLAAARDAWSALDADSPNVGRASPRLRVWRVGKPANEMRLLVDAMCAAATGARKSA